MTSEYFVSGLCRVLMYWLSNGLMIRFCSAVVVILYLMYSVCA